MLNAPTGAKSRDPYPAGKPSIDQHMLCFGAGMYLYFILGCESPIQDTESVRLSQCTKFTEHKLQICRILGSFEDT